MSQVGYSLVHQDAGCRARRGVLRTARGEVQLPAFMPVGTLGTVKGVTIDSVAATGAEMVLANTYHLSLRPGEDVVRHHGGLHEFMGWPGPILTDSGGFQIFSLAAISRVDDDGVTFRSHIDGSPLELTPERAVVIQNTLGSDIAMVLDHVVALPNADHVIAEAMRRTIRWADRCRIEAASCGQTLFAIVQGGLERGLRLDCAEQLAAMDFPGYAVGGLSVGETPEEMYDVLDYTCPVLPEHRTRYLMGVGRPQDLLQAISRGIDLFDCVIPTRNGRNALAYTDQGPLRMRNRIHQLDRRPISADCPCLACRHSRGYLRHLFMAGEMLGPILLSIHNLTYYQRLLADARQAIELDQFTRFLQQKMQGWEHSSSPS